MHVKLGSVAAHQALRNAIMLEVGNYPDVLLQPHTAGTGRPYGRRSIVVFGLGQGVGDLVGICRGKHIEFEIKTGNAKQSAAQRLRMELVRRYHGVYCVVRSVDEAKIAIEEMRNSVRIE